LKGGKKSMDESEVKKYEGKKVFLKTTFNRFYTIPTYQVNYNNYYNATYYKTDVAQNYNNDLYYITSKDVTDYNNLFTIFEDLVSDETKNLSPVDLQNIYGLIAYDIIDLSNNLKLSNAAIVAG
jgi:hypothetical protein